MTESIAAEVVSASLAGAFSASALYPLEVLKTKMQAESKCNDTNDDNNEDADDADDDVEIVNKVKPLTAVEYAKDMYAKGGITTFYSGIGTSAFQSSAEKALYFFAYTALKNTYTLFSSNQNIGSGVNLILGCIAEWAHLPITLPLDCWTTKIQTNSSGKAPFAILMSMLSEGDGIKGMYKGIQAYTVLCLKPSIQYTIFEQVKGILIARKRLVQSGQGRSNDRNNSETLSAVEAFILGMFARTVATIVVFPYLRAKVMLQSRRGVDSNTKTNIPAMILNMYSSGGLGECFQGIGPELTRGVFSAALMLMCKEKIVSGVHKLLKA